MSTAIAILAGVVALAILVDIARMWARSRDGDR